MSGSMVDVPTQDGTADAYLSKPDDGERHPGVLLIMDAYGLRSQIERMADRIAEHGFTVLAPNVFYRDASSPIVSPEELTDPERRGALWGRLRPMMAKLTPERIATTATVSLEKGEKGFAITAVHLDVTAKIPGATAQQFETVAADAKANCPVSKLLNAPISMTARLE